MKKTTLILGVIMSFGMPAFGQSPSMADVSLDFNDNGIWYTIVDETSKTCRTKSGSLTYEGTISKPVYGNVVSGAVNIPSNVTKDDVTYTVIGIGEYGFSGLTGISLPETLTEIGSYAFLNATGLTEVTVPATVTSIGAFAFYSCTSLSEVTLPETLTAIQQGTFSSCRALKSIDLPSTVTSIGTNAFSRSGLTSMTIPSTVVELGTDVFEGCTSLSEVVLPDNITAIPAYTFQTCRSLTSVTLPSSVTQIGSYAFYGCTGLTKVTSMAMTPPSISSLSFGNVTLENLILEVYKTSLDAYKKNSLWGRFGTIEAIPVEATGVSVNKSSLTLYSGFSGSLTATVEPADATTGVVWSVQSTPQGAVTVTANGQVASHSVGSAIVTATCGSYTATCNVTVLANPSARITIAQPTEDIYVGDEVPMKATVTPNTITSEVLWTSSNTDVADIDATSGLLTAKSAGGTVITALCENLTAKLAITVLEVPVTDITLDNTTYTLKPGGSVQLTATVTPSNATNTTVTWTSNDETVAIVAEGLVTALNPGVATITATCGYLTANCRVTVDAIPATSVTLNDDQVTLRATQSYQLVATVDPADATDQTIVWASDNYQVATVSFDGVITAVAVGSATIKATCGDVSATCTVNVEATPAEEVLISMTTLVLKAGQSQQLSAAVPDNTTDKTIIWSSSNPSVAEVSAEGLVTALTVGETTVTATCGEVSATCSVTVETTPAETINLSETSTTVNVGETVTLTAEVLPETTTDKTVTWSSDRDEIATVDNGTITGVEAGTAVITATCGNVTATCTVTVLNPAKSVTLNYSELTLEVGDIEDLIETVTPANTTDTPVWTSSDPDVATVDANGIVDALAEGETTVTVTYGNVSAQCRVTVDPLTDNIRDLKADKNGEYNVYDLKGLLVKKTTDSSHLEGLPSGIYIVNGMKFLVK